MTKGVLVAFMIATMIISALLGAVAGAAFSNMKNPIRAERNDSQLSQLNLSDATGSELTVALTGRMDTTTAPQLERELKESLEGVENLVLDFAALDYLSSAGLRVLLAAQKQMNKQGGMVIRHVNETIAEVFDVTGFCDILTIE